MPAAATKYSRQRECIKAYLSSTKEHPTADTIYMKVREVYPNISLGTVYRNLSLLAERGEIVKLSCGDGCDRFDGNTEPHYHFICRHCGRVIDLDMEPIEHINTIANAHFSGRVDGNITYFYDRCDECFSE